MMDTYQAQDLAVEAVGIAAYNQKPELIAVLRRNGINVPDDISERDLISITLVACAKSTACRTDLSNFLTEKTAEGQLGYVDEGFFNSVGGPRIVIPGVTPGTTAPKTETEKKKKGGKVFAKKEGGSTVGNFFRSEQGKDTIKSGLNLGFSALLKGKSGAEANQTLQSATEQGDNAGKDASGKGKSKWVLPAIIGGVLLIGVIVYFSTRGKGKA